MIWLGCNKVHISLRIRFRGRKVHNPAGVFSGALNSCHPGAFDTPALPVGCKDYAFSEGVGDQRSFNPNQTQCVEDAPEGNISPNRCRLDEAPTTTSPQLHGYALSSRSAVSRGSTEVFSAEFCFPSIQRDASTCASRLEELQQCMLGGDLYLLIPRSCKASPTTSSLSADPEAPRRASFCGCSPDSISTVRISSQPCSY